MNTQSLQTEVRRQRAALVGKDPSADRVQFVELNAAKVRRDVEADPLFYTHQHETLDAKRRERFEKRKGRKAA